MDVQIRNLPASVLILSVLFSSPLFANTWHVPVDAPTIQAGVDAASAGDTVLVACGTYFEHDIVMVLLQSTMTFDLLFTNLYTRVIHHHALNY